MQGDSRPRLHRLLLILGLCGLLACTDPVEVDPAEHQAEIDAWRANRVARLTSDDGWLTLVGLFWLDDGEHRLGSDDASEIPLPAGKAPVLAGTLSVTGEEMRLDPAEGVEILHEGAPVVGSLTLADDSEGPPTTFEIGDLVAYVIRRGEQRALRVKDRQHPARSAFNGIDSYPTDVAWRVEARFEPNDPVKDIPVPNILGTVNDTPSTGAVVFEVDGETHRLDVLAEPGDPELFIIFGDLTTGKETYGGGRYLYADAADESGRVIVDFNKAYNPPCVFTEFATCPLPPPQNRLDLRVEAGEKSYGKS